MSERHDYSGLPEQEGRGGHAARTVLLLGLGLATAVGVALALAVGVI